MPNILNAQTSNIVEINKTNNSKKNIKQNLTKETEKKPNQPPINNNTNKINTPESEKKFKLINSGNVVIANGDKKTIKSKSKKYSKEKNIDNKNNGKKSIKYQIGSVKNTDGNQGEEENTREFSDYLIRSSELIEKIQDWGIFRGNFQNLDFCYLLSLPLKRLEGKKYQGEAYFAVILTPDGNSEITTSIGDILQNNSEIELSFGFRKFYLSQHKTIAWTNNKNDDFEIIKQMQKAFNFNIIATNEQGEFFEDYYSLLGFKMAFFRMQEVCQ